MAIDAERGNPQQFRIREQTDESFVLDLFSPVPTWSKRRWDLLGSPTEPSKCLLSYRLASSDLTEETDFLVDNLWLVESLP